MRKSSPVEKASFACHGFRGSGTVPVNALTVVYRRRRNPEPSVGTDLETEIRGTQVFPVFPLFPLLPFEIRYSVFVIRYFFFLGNHHRRPRRFPPFEVFVRLGGVF